MANNKTDYPSNSLRKQSAESKTSVKKTKLITGSVTTKKKPLTKRIGESMVGEGVESVSNYIVDDILIPSAKNTALDILNGITSIIKDSVETLFFGGPTARTGAYPRAGHRDYAGAYPKTRTPSAAYVAPKSRGFDDITFERAQDAELVLEELVNTIDQYGVVSVADFYDLIGKATHFTDNEYGWMDLGSARTRRTSGGYVIDLPRTVPINS